MFISLEGIEGCGKSTQIKLLSDYLNQKNINHIITREPGGTAIGDDIRKIVLHAQNKALHAVPELFLYAASRRQHVEQIIKPALAQNKVVLCDRYVDATTAYQGYGRQLDLKEVLTINAIATDGLMPDHTLVLDLAPEQGLQRAMQRIEGKHIDEREDRFEQEALDFHQRVRDGYLTLAKQEPERFDIIDASGSIDDVQQSLVQAISNYGF